MKFLSYKIICRRIKSFFMGNNAMQSVESQPTSYSSTLKENVPPKQHLPICGLNSVISKKTGNFIATAYRTSHSIAAKNSVASVRKRTIPTELLPLVSEVSANFFAVRGCHVVSVTNPYGRILGFLDRSRYYFFQVAPQLYSRG
jgi:hypothetical protein